MKRIVAFALVVIVMFAVMGFTTPGLLDRTKLGLDLKGGFEILYEAEPLTEGGTVTQESLRQTAKSLEKRVNQNGVGEPEVTPEGRNRIRVKIAGVADEAKLRDLIKRPANLEFRSAQGCSSPTDYCKVELTGADFVEGAARVEFDSFSNPLVSIKVKEKQKLADVSNRLLNQRLAIMLDGELLTDPVVRVPLTDGTAVIEGQETIEEARNLAEVINLGALPLKLTEKYTQSVGATLGQKSLEETVLAGAIASLLILVFMIVFYRLPGFVAGICLSVYVWLLLAVFWLMGATLTLPGIAAFILGIGIAVDANIITDERIKDELRNGKSLTSALRSASKLSFRTILDAHITTLIAGIVLYYMGQGSVKGFAVVLIWSILINFVTNVFLPRFLLHLLVQSGKFNKLAYFGVKESEVRAL
jgi:SecD/SecF fusion protein